MKSLARHTRSSQRLGSRTPSRWLYVLPAVLLVSAGWSYTDRSQPRSRAYEFVDPGTNEVPLNAAADERPVAHEPVLRPNRLGATPRTNTTSNASNAASYPLEPVTDQDDPRRFVILKDGQVEDAATGIRRPLPVGAQPSDVFPSPVPRATNSVLPNDLRFGYGPRPTGLRVDEIGIKAEVVAIGIDRNRALSVPRRADVAAWWSGGSVPGESGPTVIVGHYDSTTAPGVFARLKDVKPGALVQLSQSDGSVYVYYVEEVERLKKSAFPTERVYGPTPESTLRLVTCGGKFDRKTGHYVDNTIAYASLLSFTPSPYRTVPESTSTTTTSTTSPSTTSPSASTTPIPTSVNSSSPSLPSRVPPTWPTLPSTLVPVTNLPTTVPAVTNTAPPTDPFATLPIPPSPSLSPNEPGTVLTPSTPSTPSIATPLGPESSGSVERSP